MECGRRRSTSLREVVNTIFYIAQPGCQWRLLPKEFPPFTTVQRYFYAWRPGGIWQVINQCVHVTLGRRLHVLVPGLTPRSGLEKFATKQLIDVHIPTTDGRELVLTRYSEPEPELRLLLEKLRLELPAQPPPKITAEAVRPAQPM